jgi:hypothetical protein
MWPNKDSKYRAEFGCPDSGSEKTFSLPKFKEIAEIFFRLQF